MNRQQRRAGAKTGSAPARLGPAEPQQRFEEAVRHHQAGRLADAEGAYRQVLAAEPRHPDALHLLGLVAQAGGRHDAAADLINRAIRLDSMVAAYHYNLGNALAELDRPGEAIAALEAAIRISPDHARAQASLGNALRRAGRPAAAIVAYKAACRLDPALADAHGNLGAALRDVGRPDEAVVAHAAALRIRPDHADTHHNLGNALGDLARPDEAIAAYRAAIRLEPNHAEAHANLANALAGRGRSDEAIAACEAAIRIRPDFAEAQCSLGNALQDVGRIDDAIAAFDAAIRIRPDFARARSNLGNALQDIGRHADAVASHEAAIRIDPEFVEALSNLLMSLQYGTGAGHDVLLATARRHAARVEAHGTPPRLGNVPDPDRRLRIGYVSGDLGHHPVGYFLGPVLACHDRAAVEVFCYSNHPHADGMAERLRGSADHWRSLAALPDAAAAAIVAADGIDVLIDLSGHTARNRLALFARRPAPVQASWLGYWGTTGLSRMDAILSDALTIPPGEEAGYSEQVWRLPGCRFCYAPPVEAPPPAPSPCLRDGRVTFGSFNNLAKVGPETVRLWAGVLHAVPGSRLLLKWKTLGHDRMRRRLAEAFDAAGIAADRLELRGASPHRAMLAEYGDVDIALDPHPFSGGLTSCEALWMGVPVVTLPGEQAASRQTAGFLQAVGLQDCIAGDEAGYVAVAAALAGDPEHLFRLRGGLRDRMAASPLCDGPAFTRGLEAAFRALWRQWCSREQSARG